MFVESSDFSCPLKWDACYDTRGSTFFFNHYISALWGKLLNHCKKLPNIYHCIVLNFLKMVGFGLSRERLNHCEEPQKKYLVGATTTLTCLLREVQTSRSEGKPSDFFGTPLLQHGSVAHGQRVTAGVGI